MPSRPQRLGGVRTGPHGGWSRRWPRPPPLGVPRWRLFSGPYKIGEQKVDEFRLSSRDPAIAHGFERLHAMLYNSKLKIIKRTFSLKPRNCDFRKFLVPPLAILSRTDAALTLRLALANYL